MSHKHKKKLARILLAALVFLVVFLLVRLNHLGLVAQAFLYAIPFLMAGYDVLKKALVKISQGKVFSEHFLMSLATLGAFALSFMTGEAEFAEAVFVMIFYQVGEFFEHIAEGSSEKSISELLDLRPNLVHLEEGGQTVDVDPKTLQEGQVIVIQPGEKVAIDGILVSGESSVDTAALTGESLPQSVQAGDQVLSGMINMTGVIRVKVLHRVEDSTLSKILDLLENSTAKKSKSERFMTKFAEVYTPTVVIAALILAFLPPVFSGDFVGNFPEWLSRALTFLVISCPCALVLSVPLAFFSGIGNASKHGILLKGGRVIEALANVKAVALDKTGTITSGEFKVHNVETVGSHVSSGQLLSMAAAIEAVSTHPIATSIVSEAKDQGLTVEPSDFVQELAGEGMVGMADGQQVLVGNRRLMERYDVQGYPTEPAEYGTEVLVAEGNTYLGRIIIADEARPDSAEAIADLNRQDIKTVMLTGDAEASANYIAKETGVSAVRAQLLPQDKLSVVQDIRSEYGPTMFVGDGINDAPVLAGADVGGAMGSGADAAIEAADVVFMRPSLTAIAHILDLSKSTLRVAWQNVVFAIAVKILIMALGLMGYASMWWAVFGDTGVSILCILNSVRILSRK